MKSKYFLLFAAVFSAQICLVQNFWVFYPCSRAERIEPGPEAQKQIEEQIKGFGDAVTLKNILTFWERKGNNRKNFSTCFYQRRHIYDEALIFFKFFSLEAIDPLYLQLRNFHANLIAETKVFINDLGNNMTEYRDEIKKKINQGDFKGGQALMKDYKFRTENLLVNAHINILNINDTTYVHEKGNVANANSKFNAEIKKVMEKCNEYVKRIYDCMKFNKPYPF